MNIRVLICVYTRRFKELREDLKRLTTMTAMSVKWDDPVYGSNKYYLRSRLCSIRPNNSRLLGVNNFDR